MSIKCLPVMRKRGGLRGRMTSIAPTGACAAALLLIVGSVIGACRSASKDQGVAYAVHPNGSMEAPSTPESDLPQAESGATSNGKSLEPWIVRYLDGSICSIGAKCGGYPVGAWTYFDREGRVVMYGAYDALARPTGPWVLLKDGAVVEWDPQIDGFHCKRGTITSHAPGDEYFRKNYFSATEYERIWVPWGMWRGSGVYADGRLLRTLDAMEQLLLAGKLDKATAERALVW